ncbi:uncharacterized protein C8A04DRAFT_38239 [Dichotomopilus funicola]|uniref:ATP-dependent RNA helicase n=1 Tax=Dichotomopilus funicola TaxID=1934379 RepID=A0AAN6V057_9PEZI|nr:hypothetical protein C8A04DRAFT_38239 [Dichotomopilus funicola]
MLTTDASNGKLYADLEGRLQPQLLQALSNHNFVNMTPVQEKVLSLPSFTQDCLVQAKTGTGKTLAFLLPALQNLLSAPDLDRSSVGLLVMAPTRELAQQIKDECDKLTSACSPPVECHLAVGGANKAPQLKRFLNGKPTVLVATPGRLNDYLRDDAPREKLSKIRAVVLDEADRMLDAGFAPDLRRILEQIPPKKTAGWQGMCFSATIPPEIKKMLPMVLRDDHVHLSTIDKDEVPTIDTVPQTVYPVDSVDDILPTLHSVLACACADNRELKAVIFSPTARHAALLYHIFGHTGGAAPPRLPVFQMQSRMSQTQRTRTVKEFKETESGLLFASDVVGRGMDFPDIDLVVQVGVPSEKEQYVHRVGRTGRAGKSGEAVMVLAPEEMWFIRSNPQFPIKNDGPFTHPSAANWPSATKIASALEKVPEEPKIQAYVGNLGFIKSMMKRYRLDPAGVVELGNRFATSFGLSEIPGLNPMTIGNMGLKGVPGLVVAKRDTTSVPSRRGPKPALTGGEERESRRGGRGGAGFRSSSRGAWGDRDGESNGFGDGGDRGFSPRGGDFRGGRGSGFRDNNFPGNRGDYGGVASF